MRGLVMLVLAGIAITALTGCGSSRRAATGGIGSPARRSSGFALPVRVFRGPSGGVDAFVKMMVKGRPYFFLVDTGAARTVVWASVAKALALPDQGAAFSTPTFGCTAEAQLVSVSDWKVGDMTLPAETIASVKTTLPVQTLDRITFGGVLGSDVFSHFGTMRLDFAHQRLILAGAPPIAGHTVRLAVDHGAHGGTVVAVQATVHGRQAGFIVDTGASVAAIASHTATKLGLQAIGKRLTVQGGACATTTPLVRIDDWTVGGVKLPATTASRSASFFSIKGFQRRGIVGLIGSDVLSSFGAVTIDFADRRMVLGGRAG